MPLTCGRLLTGVDRSGAASTVVIPARPPASTHTIVDTRRGLRPARRLASGLAAVAVMAMPQMVRLRNQPSASANSGMIARAMIWGARTVMSPTCQELVIGTGNRAPTPSTRGTLMASTVTSWAAPMVATNRVMRAESNSRRTTVISMAPDTAAAAATPTRSAGRYGQCQSMTILATSTAASEPVAPYAKLTIPLARYRRIMPMPRKP